MLRAVVTAGGLFVAAWTCASPALAVDVGSRAPDIGLRDMDGRMARMSGYRGKIVIVDFWASWCEPCRDEMPALQRLYARYFRDGLRVVGISVDRDLSDARDFIRRSGARFRNVHDPQRNVARRYGMSTMPTSYIVDHRGIVRHVNAGYRSADARRMERVVERLIAARPDRSAGDADDAAQSEADRDTEGGATSDAPAAPEAPVDDTPADADDPDPAAPADAPPAAGRSEAGRTGGLCSAGQGRRADPTWLLLAALCGSSLRRRRRR